jgi:DNA-binding transcriptional regulator YiaG
MGKIESVMKEEVARLARKEIRASVDPLKKEVVRLRRAVSQMTRTVGELDRDAQRRRKVEIEKLGALKAEEEEVESARINAKWVQTLRKKLNVSQTELAALLGISVSGVRTWEYDISKPRGKNKAALVALRKLGRRDVQKMLEEKLPAEE